MSFRSFVLAVIFAAITSSAAFSFDFNSTYNGTGYNSTVYNTTDSLNGTDNGSQYPFFYLYEDSYNYFCNVVAGLNYFGPLLTLFAMKGSSYYIQKWDGQIDKEIEATLGELTDAEKRVKGFLSDVIRDFDNGIGEGLDYTVAMGLVENLNNKKCSHCINEFANIVSQNAKSLTPKRNKKAFRNFAKDFNPQNCAQFVELARTQCEKKSLTGQIKSAVCDNWKHPFHWSNIGYTGFVLGLPVWFTTLMSKDMQAGSIFGDWANWSNVLVIPTTQLWNLFQNYWNYDRNKAQKLFAETDKRIEKINGIIEIAALAIEKMDNDINSAEARGFLKALILTGWQDNLVKQFRILASAKAKNFENSRTKFSHALKDAYKQKNILYIDNEIENVFKFADVDVEEALEMSSEDQ